MQYANNTWTNFNKLIFALTEIYKTLVQYTKNQ